MSKKIFCDKCGEDGNGTTVTMKLEIGLLHPHTLEKDLCRKCFSEFLDFLNDKEVDRKYV